MGTVRSAVAVVVVAFVASLVFASAARAQPALSPGPLTASHAALDDPAHCNDCHVASTRDIDPSRCLGCHDHTDLAGRIATKSGFHASDGVAGKPCNVCHKEHKGRGYDLMGWASMKGGERGLDHDLTGWRLEGKHAAAACADCHKARNQQSLRTYLGTDRACAACHKSPHDGHLFAGRPCEQCHSPLAAFRQPTFDHAERTHFDLGAHKKLLCADCHPKSLGAAKPTPPCERCHAAQNPHRDRFAAFGKPPACATCHATTRWTPIVFNHAKTKFYLTGKHSVITCRRCHRGAGPADFEDLSKQVPCKECHEHKKVHADEGHPDGKYSSDQCRNCHMVGDPPIPGPDGGSIVRIYHGPNSSFPLVKGHKNVPCADCHKTRTPRGRTSFERESPECAPRCHEDALHVGSLGQACTPCHVSGTWDALKFDHNAGAYPDGTAGYPLRGEHLSRPCVACHGAARAFKGTPRACAAAGCHATDDAHRGRLGAACERCHLETGENRFDHNAMSAFRLDGAHRQVRCTDCHPSVTFKPRPRTCAGCHPEPAAHRGLYGDCEQCHTTRAWVDVRPRHDVGDFSLRGQHRDVPCARCHRGGRPLAGSGNLCINCHRKDDIHNNALSPRCGECHTQWSFAPARFDHSRVGCSLTGLHRTVACFDCHRNGNYAALTAECTGCHLDDARRAGTRGGIEHVAQVGCASCHNANAWAPAQPPNAANRESICR